MPKPRAYHHPLSLDWATRTFAEKCNDARLFLFGAGLITTAEHKIILERMAEWDIPLLNFGETEPRDPSVTHP